MTYLASTDLLAVRSLAAEHSFSLNHRTDLPPKRPGTTRTTAETAEVHGLPRGRIFRPGLSGLSSEHEPGYTLFDLSERGIGWRVRTDDANTDGATEGRCKSSTAVIFELDAFRGQRAPRTSADTAPTGAAGRVGRRRGSRVRGYVRDLAPDERSEFATLRNTVRAYLHQQERRAA